MMYAIDSSTSINLRHVVRVETNGHVNRLHFQMSNGLDANKDFDTKQDLDDELASLTATIDAFDGA